MAGRSRLLFEFFLLSGFCSLLYQVIWMRLAFAAFGIITPVVSLVIAVFMLGLALGSWAGGRVVGKLTRKTKLSAIYLYALAELIIGIGAFAVPPAFRFGASLLEHLGESDSVAYLAFSAVALAASMLPWCIAMGATLPVGMAYLREERGSGGQTFSYLYLANVLGASLGALLTAAVLVEVLGFQRTLWIAGTVNFLIALGGVMLGLQTRRGPLLQQPPQTARQESTGARSALMQAVLFTTGLASLAMEVVWTRAFSPVLGTEVYAFAALLVTYLVGTWAGSWLYRRDLARGRVPAIGVPLLVLVLAAFLPIVLNDPRLESAHGMRMFVALASIFPLCAALGYLTPRVIDGYSAGDPRLAGSGYAINVLGCILGPLLASYLLLPMLGATLSLVVLSLPLLAFAWIFRHDVPSGWRSGGGTVGAALFLCALVVNVSYEDPCAWRARNCEVRRDYAATVVSQGEGMDRRLLVNGMGITHLTPITKFMAHLPLAHHGGTPSSGLVICFGMGTTYRSLLSWNVKTTAVELVPSVREAFPFFHADAAAVLRNPGGRIVIDDGRRFLSRTQEKYDVIVVDPPPPIEAAGSSLLYSREFHEAVRDHLSPGGVFQTWFPFGEENVARAIAQSLANVFPHVRLYGSVEGWGVHFLASMAPLERITAEQMLSRMPASARTDLAEWTRNGLRADIDAVLDREYPLAKLLPPHPSMEVTDDRPFNEYFLLRRSIGRK